MPLTLPALDPVPQRPARPVPDPAPDRRGEGDRYVTIFRTGKLTRHEAEELCVLRNISAGGAMIDHNGSFAIGDEVVLDLRRDERIAGRVAWVEGGKCGIAFAAAADLARLLGEGEGDAGPRARPPRLKLAAPALLMAGHQMFSVTLRDVSQTGACLRLGEAPVPPDPEFRLHLEGLGTYRALVRWRRSAFLGVNFVSTLPMWPLNEWVRATRAFARPVS